MGRGLLKDIDLETLYSMRRQGMGNLEIAESLGVSRSTIYNPIGAQPKELNKPTGAAAHRRNRPQPDPAPAPAACLVVERRCVGLSGVFGKYALDIGAGIVDITNVAGQTMQVPKERLGDFIDELNAIRRKMEVLAFENEMW